MLRATLYRDGRPVLRADVGVGTGCWPTPTGRFHIRNKLTRYRSTEYGPTGDFVGIHGTNRPDLIPGRVSHGCIRMRNRDILKPARRMPIGTPVTIH